MAKKILVGLSGGVDSAVSALLLKEQGYEVACGFMINYLDEENPGNCPTKADLEEAKKVAEFLHLPFYTFDYREEYERRIVDYIYREYETGRTPNPDVFCNNLVKFDLFLEEALHLGFDSIATGHYARITSPILGEAGRGVPFPDSLPKIGRVREGVSFPSHHEYIQKYAQELRQNQSLPEHLAWEQIFRKKQLLGYKFLRQHSIDAYIVDFFCHELGLIIEIDGAFHSEQKEADTIRDASLEKYGYTILRIPAYEILGNISGIYEYLKESIESMKTHPLTPPTLGGNGYRLLKGIDPSKDQSYFLSRLSEFQLSKALFPIGHLLKSEVREIAKKANLPNAKRKDSQGLCFIGKVSMKEFLERKIPKKPGNILDTAGNIVGQHEGAFSYTIGQRRGIKVGGGPALFVVAKDTVANTITVGNEVELALFSSSCVLTDWIGQFPEVGKIYGAKIRYRQEDQECTCHCEERSNPENNKDSFLGLDCHVDFSQEQKNLLAMTIQFKSPQRAITPGQVCVVYDSDMVIGSGIIN